MDTSLISSPDSGPAATSVALGELLSHAARRLRRETAAQVEPLGLTFGKARVLRAVAEAPRPLRMADVASRLDVVPRTATDMVDALEHDGLLERNADPGDRRSVLVELTASGKQMVVRLEQARRSSAEDLFSALSPSAQRALRELLGRLCHEGHCSMCAAEGTRGKP